MKHASSLLLLICLAVQTIAQTADFQVPVQACDQQLLEMDNLSTGASAFEWDLCAGELEATPMGAIFLGAEGSPFKVEMVEENGFYYGFYTSRVHGKLFRLDFGNSINNTPTRVDLGNLGISIAWLSVDIVKEDNTYYGFVLDYFNGVYRFNLGASLSGTPSQAELIYSDELLANPVDLVVQEDGSGKYVFIVNSESANLVTLAFGSSYNVSAGSITKSSINLGAGNNAGIAFIKTSAGWFAIVSTIGGSLLRVHFDAGLGDATPSINSLTGLPFSPSYRGVAVAFDNNEYFVFATSSTNLYRVELGTSITNNPQAGSDLGTFGLFSNVFGFSMYKSKSDWIILSSENSGPNIYRITFPSACFSSVQYTTEEDPVVPVINPGTASFTLTAFDNGGNSSTKEGTLVVLTDVAPEIDINTENVCVAHDVNFHAEGSAGISSYTWTFGDASPTASGQDAVHQYSASGVYTVRLDVGANNGCTNFTFQTIEMYDPPVASFDLPAGLICTNSEVTFENTTSGNFGGLESFEWLIDGVAVGTSYDLTHSFTSAGDQEISLAARIPGCENVLTRDLLNVMAGPTAAFNVSGKCEGTAIEFDSETSGDVVSSSWDFGDGQTGSGPDVQHVFNDGSYIVGLDVESSNGCVTSVTQPLTVYSTPAVDFSLDLPPFSCAGSPSQFHDITPTPSDSNLQSWAWTFGDGASDTGKNPVHTYAVAGGYTVGLTVTSDQGCEGTKSGPVTISTSPSASIAHSAACVNTQTAFQGTTSGTAKSWSWTIGSTTYNIQNPTHVFATSGSVSAQLTVTASNNCVTTVTKAVTIPVVPVLDFSASNACTGQSTTLTASATGTPDPVTIYKWDFGGGLMMIGQTATHSFGTPGSQSVGMSTVHESGCTYSLTKSVTINPTPVAAFIPAEEYGAAPLSVAFSNSSTGATTYLWQFDDGNTSNESSPSHVFDELGVYEISMQATSDAGCIANTSGRVHVIIPHTDLSISDLGFIPETGSATVKGVMTITNHGNYPITAFDLVLETGSGVMITEHVSQALPPQSELTLFTQNSLTFAGVEGHVCVSVVVTGDEDTGNDRQCQPIGQESVVFDPYPNPSRGTLLIQFVADAEDELDIRLVNETGADAYSKKVVVVPGLNLFNLDVSNLGPGLYVVRAASSSSLITRRIVIIN